MKKLTIALLLITSSALAQEAPPPAIAGIQVPTVFDADNKAIGQLLTIEGRLGKVLLKLADPADAVVTLGIARTRDGDVKWINQRAFFSLPDCRGTAAVMASDFFGDYASAVDADGTLHIGDTANDGGTFMWMSRYSQEFCENAPQALAVSPAIVLTPKLKLSDHFKTPLRVDNLHRARTRSVGP